MKHKDHRLKLSLTIILFGVFFTSNIIAQEKKIAFEKYGVAEGLPEEYVSSIVQDDQGFMWFSTQNGLVKFDGYDMKVYKAGKDYNDNPDLQARNLNSILKTSDGKLWFGSVLGDGSYTSFNPVTEKFRTYKVASQNNTFNVSEVMFEDKASNIWIVNSTNKVDSMEVTKLNTKTNVATSYPHQMRPRKINAIFSNAQMLCFEANNSIWLNDDAGNLMVYNSQQDKFNTIVSAGSEIPGTEVSDTIKSIFKGNKEHFLLVGKNSLTIWDPINKSSINSYSNDSAKDNTFSGNKIAFWAFEDAMGHYWTGYENAELIKINPEHKKNATYTYGQGALQFPDTIENVQASGPIFQNEKGIWFAFWNSTNCAFIYYDLLKKSFHHYNKQFNDDKNPLQLTPRYISFSQMIEDKTGYLWYGTRPNFYKESPKTRQIELFNYKPKDIFSIPSDTINKIHEDSKQRLWVATERGLTRKIEDNKFKSYYFKNSSRVTTPLGKVVGIYEDSKGRIWATTNGNGLLYLNEDKQEFVKYSEKIGQNILDIQEDKYGQIWVSSDDGGVNIIDPKSKDILKTFKVDDKDEHGLLSHRISELFLDSRGDIWLGDSGENDFGVFKYNESVENFKHYKKTDTDSLTLNSYEIRNFIEDDRERMWVNTDGGVNLYDHENDVFYPSKKSVNMASSRTLIKGTNGKVWVATYASGGLALVGPDINEITMFGENTGLLHNDIADLIFDDYGKLWLPTERGLSVLDTLTKTYSSYFETDGYQKYSRNGTILKTQNGDIWIGGYNGLNHVVPSQLSKKELSVPSVLITSMGIMDSTYIAPDGEIFKKAVSFTEKIDLKHWQKNVGFDFVGLHYLQPKNNLYSWTLENYDTHWTTPSKDRQASYTNLSPGTYIFKVKASNADGVWNETGAQMEIIIHPPWWQTWWAYLLYAIGLVLALSAFFKWRTKNLQNEKQLLEHKVSERTKELKSSIDNLKATQTQLVHAEKMASLGELTAGIAHEIQNPLNFVNNFSEVNQELVDELIEELDKGNIKESKIIALDIKTNEEKINHHGNRADSIVKGMLKHSRNHTGEKLLTNINVLCDEYLRLAYHGLRAKDKSFNATLETDFDQKFGEILVVPQEIGRVVLNIINNGLFAVKQKQDATKDSEFKPTIWISTKELENKIIITIRDNGNGIPYAIKDKIFLPFFTTKATGDGTGLGLSMSYDIIKAHGGELIVDSEDKKGTTFTVSLPTK
jgi:signal transduction histidine kinase/ligand-binding sensor domain-containing protein